MTVRLNIILLLVLLGSAIYLVRISYDARRLFTQLDRAQSEARALDIDHERLLAERQAQSTPLRIEKTARERLAMRTATPAVTQYVVAPAPGAPVTRFLPPPLPGASAAASAGGSR